MPKESEDVKLVLLINPYTLKMKDIDSRV